MDGRKNPRRTLFLVSAIEPREGEIPVGLAKEGASGTGTLVGPPHIGTINIEYTVFSIGQR